MVKFAKLIVQYCNLYWVVKILLIWILRDIYIYVCMYVGLSTGNPYKNTYAKMRVRNYVAQTRACSKSVLGG